MSSSRVRNKRVLLPPRKVYWRYRITVRTLQRLGAVKVWRCNSGAFGPCAYAVIKLRPGILQSTASGKVGTMVALDPYRYVSHSKTRAAVRLLELLQWHIDKEIL